MASSEFKNQTPENKSTEEKIVDFLNKHHKDNMGKWVVSDGVVKYEIASRLHQIEPEHLKAMNDPNTSPDDKEMWEDFYRGELHPGVSNSFKTIADASFIKELEEMGLRQEYIGYFLNSFLTLLRRDLRGHESTDQNVYIKDPDLLNTLRIISDTDRPVKNTSEIKGTMGLVFFENKTAPLTDIVTGYLTKTQDLEESIEKLAAKILGISQGPKYNP